MEYAVKLRDQGMGLKELAAELNRVKEKIRLTGVPSDMIYLKKGGRVSPMVASIGDVLGIKPVLVLSDGVIECVSKARGCKNAKLAMQKLFEDSAVDYSKPIYFGHSDNPAKGEDFKFETCNRYTITGAKLHNVGPAIGSHIGPDALLLGWFEQ